MKRERRDHRKPYGRGDYELHRGGEGVYWQAANGLEVRLAAAEHPRDTEHSCSLGEAASLEVGPGSLAR